ncbi:TetR/AcrR family transcriptional regulator [Rhodococcus artemisiae]|uniref:TetR/AcrR family transcriptional regulator n=1 Tax=Rhodococcus artemisiae TaxID=714159 RepID=UPI0038B63C58
MSRHPDPSSGNRRDGIRSTAQAARTRILDAAEALFAEQGFDSTATTAIATAAHVPKGLIFYYFPTKEAILDALIAERLPTEPISDVVALVAPGDPATSLVNLDTALNLGQNDSSVLRVIIWREAETHTDVRTHVRTLRAHLHDTTMRVLQASSPAPVSVSAVRTAATAWVSAMLSAATTDRLFGRDGLPRAHEELQNVARLIAAGMSGMTPLPRMLARAWT